VQRYRKQTVDEAKAQLRARAKVTAAQLAGLVSLDRTRAGSRLHATPTPICCAWTSASGTCLNSGPLSLDEFRVDLRPTNEAMDHR
jgi:hypothetical protein